jgi:hypothetical protein
MTGANDPPNHDGTPCDGTPRDDRAQIFGVPEVIGRVRSVTAWRGENPISQRVIGALAGGALAVIGYRALTSTWAGPWRAVDAAVCATIAAACFALFAAPEFCTCVGSGGISLSPRRLRAFVSRRVLRFADVDDVAITWKRIVSDAVYCIYSHTDVRFAWLDRSGEERFVIVARVVEPTLAGAPTFDHDAPHDQRAFDGMSPRSDAILALAAVDAFRAFQDQRERPPYR